MGRKPCCSKEGLNRGAWSAREDNILKEYINTHGEGKWRDLPKRAGLKRCGKSCRLRWLNYLRPDIKRGNISCDEEELIVRLHKLLGNRWSLIAGRLPGRTDNEIKNYWNTYLGKKVNSPAAIEQPNAGKKTAERSHRVIRTKAARCTRAYIPTSSTQQEDDSPIFANYNNPDRPIENFLDIPVDFNMEEFMAGIECDGGFVDKVCEDENALRFYGGSMQEDWGSQSDLRSLFAILDYEDDTVGDMGGSPCVA